MNSCDTCVLPAVLACRIVMENIICIAQVNDLY